MNFNSIFNNRIFDTLEKLVKERLNHLAYYTVHRTAEEDAELQALKAVESYVKNEDEAGITEEIRQAIIALSNRQIEKSAAKVAELEAELVGREHFYNYPIMKGKVQKERWNMEDAQRLEMFFSDYVIK